MGFSDPRGFEQFMVFVWMEVYTGNKIDVRNLVNYLNWAPIFNWYLIRCGFKNRYKNDICSKEVILHAQNMITIIGSHNIK